MTYPPRNPRGVIFSAPMILALLAGAKTQTRRLSTSPLRRVVPGDTLWVREAHGYVGTTDPGWLLFRATYEDDCRRHGFDEPFPDPDTVTWTPSIHMPRKASRLTLIVEDVRFEPLRDITEADAKAEGATYTEWSENHKGMAVNVLPGHRYREGYALLWDSLHAAPVPVRDPETKAVIRHDPNPGRWEANPEVVAITFSVARRNIDTPPAP